MSGDEGLASHHASAEHEVEVRKEAFTMAFYVAICLMAALAAVAESAEARHVDVLGLVWGTTVGLALAHWLAFRLSARLVAGGEWRRHDAMLGVAQIVGAVAVAVIVSVPVLLLPATAELDVGRVVLSIFIAFAGFEVARGGGASVGRSTAFGAGVLVLAATVAVVKNVLSGH